MVDETAAPATGTPVPNWVSSPGTSVPDASRTTREPAPRAAELLAWYDRHQRALPWRAGPGETSDPYAVLVSEVMLQQTTAKAVGPFYAAFLSRFPTLADLAAADESEVLRAWTGLGYYRRARMLHACAHEVMARHDGRLPADERALLELPGLGPYTAAAVAAIAYGLPATPVDGNVERVISRVFRVERPLPGARPELRRLAATLTSAERPGDYAQGVMDLGATICTPRRPACVLCPWREPCAARAAGDQESYPRKDPKREGATRFGAAYVAVRADGAVLLETRAPGLLGGMTGTPVSPWAAETPDAMGHAPVAADWRRVGAVRHVFTHFPLELEVWRADLPAGAIAPEGTRFVAVANLAAEAVPTLFKRVLAAAGVEVG